MDINRFMKLHAEFMNYEGDVFEDNRLCGELHSLLLEINDPREIKNPENKETYGYIAIVHSYIFTRNGNSVGTITKGDVLAMNFCWDRNVIVTHFPLGTTAPIPYLLKNTDSMSGLKGVWLPIFEPELIWRFVKKKLQENKEKSEAFLKEEQKFWR